MKQVRMAVSVQALQEDATKKYLCLPKIIRGSACDGSRGRSRSGHEHTSDHDAGGGRGRAEVSEPEAMLEQPCPGI